MVEEDTIRKKIIFFTSHHRPGPGDYCRNRNQADLKQSTGAGLYFQFGTGAQESNQPLTGDQPDNLPVTDHR